MSHCDGAVTPLTGDDSAATHQLRLLLASVDTSEYAPDTLASSITSVITTITASSFTQNWNITYRLDTYSKLGWRIVYTYFSTWA